MVLAHGHLVEQGAHEDLMQIESGFYKSLVASQ
jgi:ABC-type multidrug transport system fused ATPase/permease subunit